VAYLISTPWPGREIPIRKLAQIRYLSLEPQILLNVGDGPKSMSIPRPGQRHRRQNRSPTPRVIPGAGTLIIASGGDGTVSCGWAGAGDRARDPPGDSSRGATSMPLRLALAFPFDLRGAWQDDLAGNTHVIRCGPLQCQAMILLA